MSYRMSIAPNVNKSPYFNATVADGVAGFAVYNHMYMPTHYGDPAAEYDRLINGAAMWDVGCERQVELSGPDAGILAQYLTPRDISDAAIGQGKYIHLCAHDGTLINDPIIFKLSDTRYWLSIADSDIYLWASAVAAERNLAVKISRPDVSPLAVQGPTATDVVAKLLGDWVREIKYFWFKETVLDGIPMLVVRSGWSKQGGFELFLLDGRWGTELWNRVKAAGQSYGIGPGAPSDVERIESGLLSFGTDADEQTNPFEAGLGQYVDLDRDDEFIGKTALREIVSSGIKRRRVGLILSGDRIEQSPHPYPIRLDDDDVGTLSETVYSPRLERNIAIALVSVAVGDDGTELLVDTGQEVRTATVTPLPFC